MSEKYKIGRIEGALKLDPFRAPGGLSRHALTVDRWGTVEITQDYPGDNATLLDVWEGTTLHTYLPVGDDFEKNYLSYFIARDFLASPAGQALIHQIVKNHPVYHDGRLSAEGEVAFAQLAGEITAMMEVVEYWTTPDEYLGDFVPHFDEDLEDVASGIMYGMEDYLLFTIDELVAALKSRIP